MDESGMSIEQRVRYGIVQLIVDGERDCPEYLLKVCVEPLVQYVLTGKI